MPQSASARFRRPNKNDKSKTDYLPIHAWKKQLSAMPIRGFEVAQKFATTAELIAAFAAACEAAEAEGWTEYGPPTTWRERIADDAPKRPRAAEAEKRFEAISAELASALVAAKGKRAAEKKAIVAALRAYGDLKVALGADRTENAVHFFAVDGVGLTKKRKAALLRAKVDAKTSARWLELLEAAVTK